MLMRRRSKPERGFTLLEIIVVLAVLGALAALLTPVVSATMPKMPPT